MRQTSLDDFTFFHPLRVRWSEVDLQGIVFNPNYFVYADVAMNEHMRTIGFAYPSSLEPFGTDLYAVNASADFRAPAAFDDELRIGARVSYIGRTSLRFAIGVFREVTILAEISLAYVHADRRTRAPTPLPQPLIDRILKFERTRPERKETPEDQSQVS